MRQNTVPAMAYRHFGGFRLLLATMVMWQHFAADLAPAWLAHAAAPYDLGDIAVLIFFALSGFVITEAADAIYRDRPAAFIGNRLLRIMPHFLFAVLLSFAALLLYSWIGGTHLWRSQPSYPAAITFTSRNIIMNLLGVMPLADRLIDYNVLDIAWAVRVEMGFYFAICLCLAAGRRIPSANGFVVATCVLGLLLTVPFVLAVGDRGIAMLRYLPYFSFGSALYFGVSGSRRGRLVAVLSLAAILWQFLVQPPASPFADGPGRATEVGVALLCVLLAVMTWLAGRQFRRFRRIDSRIGGLTYPLYLYHEVALVVLLTLTTGYSYLTFAAGLLASFGVAMALAAVIDPIVTHWRDRVRGRQVVPPV